MDVLSRTISVVKLIQYFGKTDHTDQKPDHDGKHKDLEVTDAIRDVGPLFLIARYGMQLHKTKGADATAVINNVQAMTSSTLMQGLNESLKSIPHLAVSAGLGDSFSSVVDVL